MKSDWYTVRAEACLALAKGYNLLNSPYADLVFCRGGFQTLHYTGGNYVTSIRSGLSLTSPPGPLSKYWRGGEKRILKSPLHAMGRGFRGGVNA